MDEDIFSVNLYGNNDNDQIKFDKSKTYAVRDLSIGPNIQAGVLLPSVEGKKALCNILRMYVEEKYKFNLDLRIARKDWFNIVVPFRKRTDVL